MTPRRRPLAVAAVAVLLATGAAAAASLDVRLDPPRIGVEDATRLVVRVHEPEGPVAVPELGELENLEVVSGPSTGEEIQLLNGVVRRSVSFTWVLRPAEVGTARVGTVEVRVGDEIVTSRPVAMEVVAGSLAPRARPRRRNPFDPFGDLMARGPAPAPQLELRHLVSAERAALGEPVPVAVALDSTVGGIDSFDWLDPPTYPGWWTQRVALDDPITPERVEVDGVVYNRFVIARFILVPLRSGELEVPPVRARIAVRGRSLFAVPQVLERASRPAVIRVDPRPEPPVPFAGAVGRMSYSAEVEPDRVGLGESAVVSVRLEGNGNLPLVEAPPAFPSCEPCQTYPPEEDSDVTVAADGIRGSRTWRVTVVPRAAGALRLGPVEVAVFDPATRSYRRQTLGPLELVVTPPPATPTPSPTAEELARPRPPGTPASGGAAGDAERGHRPASPWRVALAAAVAGAALGGLAVWIAVRRRSRTLPPRRRGESAAERARELQLVLERWWLGVRDGPRAEELRPEMEALRRGLEGVRFAPGRADHTETVEDLEARLRRLLRRR